MDRSVPEKPEINNDRFAQLLMKKRTVGKLALAICFVALWPISDLSSVEGTVWLTPDFRPELYNRGRRLSRAFHQYLDTHFASDAATEPRPTYPVVAEGKPRNLIFMIGDGMGLGHSDAAALAAYGVGGRLNMYRMPIVGLVATQSATSLGTDSAAAGTALTTGFRTFNGAIGISPDGQPLESFFRTAQRHGKRVGLAVRSSVTHATPASFFANVRSRYQEAEVASQLVARRINVLLGGGIGYFIPRSHPSGLSMRFDDRDVLVEAINSGYRITFEPDELTTVTGDLVMGLYGAFAMPSEDLSPEKWPRPSLADMTDKAIDLLSKGNQGFCLLVEGSQIDWKAHASDFEGVLWETLEFDRAVARCLEFAEKDGNTLVLVTADHETGGLGLAIRGTSGLSAYWSTGAHTAIRVPLYAYGPGCLEFAGVYDNVDVAAKCATLLGLGDFPGLNP